MYTNTKWNIKKQSELYGNIQKYKIKSLYDNIIAVEDAEIILAIFSPNKAKLSTHRGYDIKQLDDSLYAIYFIASEGARPACYFSSSSNDEETSEKILHYDGSIRL